MEPAALIREYLMLGLPVYAGYHDVFPPSFRYFRAGQVELSSIVEYAAEVREVARDAVSEAARPYIDKDVLLSRLSEELRDAPKQVAMSA